MSVGHDTDRDEVQSASVPGGCRVQTMLQEKLHHGAQCRNVGVVIREGRVRGHGVLNDPCHRLQRMTAPLLLHGQR